MNYCFNCGARISNKDQKFCIECGTDLRPREEKHADFKKGYRKKYSPKKGESYIEYLNRIDSPLKDVEAASKIKIEDESRKYTGRIRKDKEEYHYPDDTLDSDDMDTINNLKNLFDDMDSDSDEDRNQKEIITNGYFGEPALSTEGNFIVEGMYGRPKYYIDGDIIREKNQFGKPAYRIDGNYIREGMYGKPKYYIDGDLIKENNQFGKVVGRRKKVF